MDIILLERVHKLGQMGDVVKVKDGFARNFLLPLKKALRATKANKEKFEGQKVQLQAINLSQRTEAEKVKVKLDGQTFLILRQAGEAGLLYGSVSTRDVSDVVTAGGFTLNRNQVGQDRAIKSLGLHKVRLILHPEVFCEVTVNVARTPEEAERQLRGENVLIEKTDEELALEDAEALFEKPEELEADAAEPKAAPAVEDDGKKKKKKKE
jgi:large subunit ribosomal protein L9